MPIDRFHRRRQPRTWLSFSLLKAAACGLSALLLRGASASAAQNPASVRLVPGPGGPHEISHEYSPHADEAGFLLWRNAPLSSATSGQQPSRAELQSNLRTALATDPTLSELYSWRQMLRGQAQREWKFGNTAKGGVRLGIGAQKLPVLQLAGIGGTRAAVVLSNNRFGFGTTRPMSALNAAMAPADAMLGETISYDQSSFDWVTVQPLSTRKAQVNLIYLRGQNDLAPNSKLKDPAKMIRGTVTGATVSYLLPASWKLSGEWLSSNMQERGSDSAWLVTLAGPIQHPLGKAQIEASYRDVGPRFASFIGTPSDAGATTRQLSIQQPLGQGKWTGSVGAIWTEREFSGESPSGQERTDSTLRATASARWQMTPKLALTASHITNRNTLDPDLGVLTARENSDTQAGLEWKIGSGVALVMGFGASRQSTLADGDEISFGGKNRLSLALRHQTPTTTWNLQLARDAMLNPVNTPTTAAESVAFDADRRLTSWLKLGGTYRLSQNAATVSGSVPATDLTARAAFSLEDLGALELCYSQRQTASGVRLGNSGPVCGYGVRYQIGAKDGQEGFGLSLDYATRLVPNAPETQWKLGITYR